MADVTETEAIETAERVGYHNREGKITPKQVERTAEALEIFKEELEPVLVIQQLAESFVDQQRFAEWMQYIKEKGAS